MRQNIITTLALLLLAFNAFAMTSEVNCCPMDEEHYGSALAQEFAQETIHAQIAGSWKTIEQNGADHNEQWLIKEDGTFTRENEEWAIKGHWMVDYQTNTIYFSVDDDDGTEIEEISLTILDIDYHTAVLANKQVDAPSVIYLTKA